ncbi:hypothetical protein T492DRAFT_864711 [Pavlovales sp. CCMP2436]|nr:hypothetical protein T492DRAFT_864711 [Pavlovales sp. CCMP2436]
MRLPKALSFLPEAAGGGTAVVEPLLALPTLLLALLALATAALFAAWCQRRPKSARSALR